MSRALVGARALLWFTHEVDRVSRPALAVAQAPDTGLLVGAATVS